MNYNENTIFVKYFQEYFNDVQHVKSFCKKKQWPRKMVLRVNVKGKFGCVIPFYYL